MNDYLFYDSKHALVANELQELYRFTTWGRSRSVQQIEAMLRGTTMCFSVRHESRLVAFCRILTDFVFRGSLWDVIVHPDHQGKGVGTAMLRYALYHPAICSIPVITTYTSEMIPFMERMGFARKEGVLVLQRGPIEYS